MKLIIDIPEEVYEYWKEHKYEYVLSEAIANGIPYEPKGDLISRSALKDKLTDTINPNDIAKNEWYEGYAACVQVLSDLIDNAPTVQPLIKPIAEIKVEAKPQGKWVDGYGGEYRCTNCSSHSERITPYCWCCGADMRGDKE